MGQHPAVRDTQTKGVSSGKGLTSAYDTIVLEKDPTVKLGEICGTAVYGRRSKPLAGM